MSVYETLAGPNRARVHPHRTYAQEFKQQVIRETLEPGMSVSIVARLHDINANGIGPRY
ncbi:transposase [Burkholderia cenocepacia]|uniref:transposase n=1 Tax=Burkholderia cenocepacia TaxID=95486 RepID=UPI00158A5DB2